MLKRVQTFIQKHNLLKQGEKVLVGISGGADSVALLSILVGLNYECLAVHCNFHLRGEESDADELFVEQLCKQLNVKLIKQDFDTVSYAKEHHLSIEMAARNLRYDLFETIRKRRRCKAIAVAHHKNDQAETLLLNLYRGTGIRGLRGMLPKNGKIIRPLLCTTHQDILDFLTINHLQHREDSTNSDTSIPRNLIRQQLSVHPQATVEHIAQTAQLMQGYINIFDDYIDLMKAMLVTTEKYRIYINIESLVRTTAPDIILYEILKDFGFTQIDQIFRTLNSPSGRYFYSSKYTLLKDREYLIITPRNVPDYEPEISYKVRNKKKKEVFPYEHLNRIIVDSHILDNPLTIRHYQEGDKFQPIGMKGTRKLQDFFTDLHLTREEKKDVWLLLSGDEIAWVIGYRISDKFKVTDQTKQVAEISIDL